MVGSLWSYIAVQETFVISRDNSCFDCFVLQNKVSVEII